MELQQESNTIQRATEAPATSQDEEDHMRMIDVHYHFQDLSGQELKVQSNKLLPFECLFGDDGDNNYKKEDPKKVGEIWNHISRCTNQDHCDVKQCTVLRYLMGHFTSCEFPFCHICQSIRGKTVNLKKHLKDHHYLSFNPYG